MIIILQVCVCVWWSYVYYINIHISLSMMSMYKWVRNGNKCLFIIILLN